MLAGYQAESELFRGCGNDDDDDDDEYQEHLRRMREIEARKLATASGDEPNAAASTARAQYAEPHTAAAAAPAIRTALEAEHERRQEGRQRILEKEKRFGGYVDSIAGGGLPAGDGPAISRSELDTQLRESARMQGKATNEFVQAFR